MGHRADGRRAHANPSDDPRGQARTAPSGSHSFCAISFLNRHQIMLRSGTTGAALEPLRTRFRVVAREVTGGLGAISARVYELPEAHRPALLAGVLDLERKQLQLRQYVEQMPLGDGADPQVLENAVRQQLELLANVTALAQRVGLIPPKAPPPPVRAAAAAASRARPSYHHEFANALDG